MEPHRLVSVGRRWYLVAFDLRRDGWRTFRLDRMSDVRRAGPRFTPREIPGGDAAAFVRRSLGARPLAHEVEVLVDGPAEQVEATCRWIGGEVTEVTGDGCRVVLRADTLEWIAMSLAHLAIDHPIRVHGTADLQSVVASLRDRLHVIPTEF